MLKLIFDACKLVFKRVVLWSMNKHWMVCWLELGTQQTTRSTQKQTLCSIVNPIELESCQKFWLFVDKLLIILSSLGENYCCSKFYCLIDTNIYMIVWSENDDEYGDDERWENPITSDRDICFFDILCSTCFQKALIKSPSTEICRRWGSVWKYQKYAKTFDSQETRSQMLLKL